MVQVSSGNASLKMLSERDKEIGAGNELRGAGSGGSIAGMENSVCGMFRWRQAWHPRHSKNEKDAGAVGPRGFSSQERRPSHLSLSGQ